MSVFARLFRRFKLKPAKKREWKIWIGDGMAADARQQIGRPVNIHGRTGKVVDATDLLIQVEWD
jgi:hypothetical protein